MVSLRRTLLPLIAVSALTLSLAACGSSAEQGSDTIGAGTAGAAPLEDGALPVTIEHRFGETTVEEEPQRVVVAGLREQDALLALGIVPVATTKWYGEHPGGIYPWARDELGDAPLPKVLDFTDGVQFEEVAALRPDLIVSIYSGLSEQDYEKLAAIAPTIAQPPGQIDWGSSWQDEIAMVGRALGRPQAAERVRRRAEDELETAAREHPEFEGAPALVGTNYEGLYVYGPDDGRSKLLADLGFSFPARLNELGGDEFGAVVPDEQVATLDVDAMVWLADPGPAAEIRRHPVYRGLDVRREGRDVFISESGPFYESTSFVSVLSMPTLLKGLVPKLAAAVDGDPETQTG